MRRILKIAGWTGAAGLIILLAIAAAVHIPFVQNYIADRAVSMLAGDLGTHIEIDRFRFSLTGSAEIGGLYIEDQRGDTLWYSGLIAVRFRVLPLLTRRIDVDSILLENAVANIHRAYGDEAFNFDFPAAAVSDDDKASENLTEAAERDTSPWRVSLRSVELNGVRAAFADEAGGMEAEAWLDRFSLEMREMDLQAMEFGIASADMRGFGGRVVLSADPPPRESEPAEPAQVTITADSIRLMSTSIGYHNTSSGESADIDFDAFNLTDVAYASEGNVFSIASLAAVNAAIRVADDNHSASVPGGFNTANVDIYDLNAGIRDVRMAGMQGGLAVEHFSFSERGGFRLRGLALDAAVGEYEAYVRGLTMLTDYSEISGSFSVRYPSFDTLRTDPGLAEIDLSLDESFLGLGDVLYISPDLARYITADRAEGIAFAASAAGAVNDLTIAKFDARIINDTYLSIGGTVSGMPDAATAHFSVSLEELSTGSAAIMSWVDERLLPEGFAIPPTATIAGTFEGTLDDFAAAFDAHTSYGDVHASLRMDRRDGRDEYKGRIYADRVDAGRLLELPEQFGVLSLTAAIEGRGLDITSIDAHIDATVESARIGMYTYRNLHIDGRFRERRFTGFAGMDDEHLGFRFNGDVHLTETEPAFSFELEIDHADLNELRLMDDGFILSGVMAADFTGGDFETLDGSLRLTGFHFIRGIDEYRLDSLVVTAVSRADQQQIAVDSDIFSATYEGNITVAELPAFVFSHVNDYFDLHHLDVETEQTDIYFDFSIALHDAAFVSDILLPELEHLSPSTISGSYRNRSLGLTIEVPHVHYATYEADSIFVSVSSDGRSIVYDIDVGSIGADGRGIAAPRISGSVEDDIVTVLAVLRDRERRTVFGTGVTLESADTVYTFSLIPGELVLNYDRWTVAADNYIRVDEAAIFFHNVRMNRGETYILVQSVNEGPSPPAELTVHQFDLSDLNRLFDIGNSDGDETDISIGGILNVKIRASDIFGEPAFDANVTVSSFAFGSNVVGDISIGARQKIAGHLDLDMSIVQNDNEIRAAGSITTDDGESRLDIAAEIRNIDIASLEGFTFGAASAMSGSIAGRFTITGTTAEPIVEGDLSFRSVEAHITQLNTQFSLADETVSFNRDGVRFRNVTIRDADGNTARINGTVTTREFSEYAFNVDIRSNNFLLMNSTAQQNELFYGRVHVDSDIQVRGDQNLPSIQATIGFREGTELTVVIPETDPVLVEREGIVEFVRMDEDRRPIREEDEDPVQSMFQGMDIAANINVDPETGFRVVIDERAGDYVQVRGGGTLSLGVDQSGLLSISGRYEISSGAYQMTFYDVSRRRFDIRPGSSIVWTGDPTDAEIDISAIYTVRTSPLELVEDYVTEAERHQYRRALPFQVYLNMRGNLMQPEIDFALDMPADQRGAMGGTVYGRVRQLNEQESERNKQVFALLVLNRFLPENPLEMQEGGGLAAGARSSASRLLTQQLNALSGRYIRGLDISFDVESYEEYTEEGTRGRTELQLQVSHQFLDDRVTVEVGGQFDIEGERRRRADASDFAGDITVEYKLTEDGRYRLRGFRMHEYHGLIDGDLTNTGLALVFTRDFNRFRELFRRVQPDDADIDEDIVRGSGEEEESQ
jgi:translocation and assembly module TamB